MHVERVPFLSATTFYKEYLDVRPVVITEMTQKWPARRTFTLERLRDELGDIVVTLRSYSEASDESFLVQTGHDLKRVTLRDFLTAAAGGVPSELVKAWSMRVSTELFEQVPALKGEFDFDGLFPRGHKRYDHFLWIGPPGYTTGLHTDEVPVNLLAHFVGHKTVTLYDPAQTALLYPETRESVRDSMYSAVNVMAPDLVKHPDFAKARALVAELTPGDLLYIPGGWWHWVRGHDLCISVSALSFSA
jgi:hypothetical protein